MAESAGSQASSTNEAVRVLQARMDTFEKGGSARDGSGGGAAARRAASWGPMHADEEKNRGRRSSVNLNLTRFGIDVKEAAEKGYGPFGDGVEVYTLCGNPYESRQIRIHEEPGE